MKFAVEDFAAIVGGHAIGFLPGDSFEGFALDSREVTSGCLFLAIIGERVDGHEFVTDAIKAGARGSMVERPVEGPYILVSNLVHALARLGRHFRDQFGGTVVGVTGSTGKTIAKEFIAAAISPIGPVLKTLGNRNTEFSAPLRWTEVSPADKSAVIEMGMRGFDQIAHLCAISCPTIGVITNIGWAHLELVKSRDGIAKAKGELLQSLPTSGHSVLWQGDDYLESLKAISPCEVHTFGFEPNAECQVVGYERLSWAQCKAKFRAFDEEAESILPACGRHVAIDAAAAVMVARLSDVSLNEACGAIENAEIPANRMQIHDVNGVIILMDAYNAGPPSMEAALRTLEESPVRGNRLAVIGEMRELGAFSKQCHVRLGQQLAEFNVDRAICVGDATLSTIDAAIASGLSRDKIQFAKSDTAVSEFLSSAHEGDAVLVKGSRALELEKIVDLWRSQYEG